MNTGIPLGSITHPGYTLVARWMLSGNVLYMLYLKDNDQCVWSCCTVTMDCFTCIGTSEGVVNTSVLCSSPSPAATTVCGGKSILKQGMVIGVVLNAQVVKQKHVHTQARKAASARQVRRHVQMGNGERVREKSCRQRKRFVEIILTIIVMEIRMKGVWYALTWMETATMPITQ